MTSLTDVYDGDARSVAGGRRKALGTGLVAAGAVMLVGAIPLATTELGSAAGLSTYGARELAGILAGLGLPAVFVGIFAVLPANRHTRAAAAIGASLAVFGVAMFAYAYPYQWLADNPGLAVATSLLYSLGALVTFWCLFISTATFKLRDDPGGAARMAVTEEGTLRVIRDETREGIRGGIGLFGRDPEGDVETQTNRPAHEAESADSAVSTMDDHAHPADVSPADTPGDGAVVTTSDGAGAVADPAEADDAIVEAVKTRGKPDQYCGNCEHFEYVRANGAIAPHCGLHEELMDDMDACDQWSENS